MNTLQLRDLREAEIDAVCGAGDEATPVQGHCEIEIEKLVLGKPGTIGPLPIFTDLP